MLMDWEICSQQGITSPSIDLQVQYSIVFAHKFLRQYQNVEQSVFLQH